MSHRKDRAPECPKGYRVIYRRYIVKNGKRIYPKNAKAFRLLVKVSDDE